MIKLNGFHIKLYSCLVVILYTVKKQHTYILEVPLENVNTHTLSLKNSFHILFEHAVILTKETL